MTFAAVGAFLSSSAATFTLTPAAVGDLILLEIINVTDNANLPSLASSNVTWTPMGASFAGTQKAMCAQVFAGTVTAASSATVTVTWSPSTPASWRIGGQEFSSTVGSWAIDGTIGHIDLSAGTNTWASLPPTAAGELYFGFAFDGGSASAGSTPGYTYDADGSGNGCAFNPACTSAAQAPVWGDSGSEFGVMLLVAETGTGPVVLVGAQGGAGGDRDPEVRVFRHIDPAEIPVSGSALPQIACRGYAGPPPEERAGDTAHDWLEEQAPREPGPGVAEVARGEAERAARGLYGLGLVLAPVPYVAPGRAKCGAVRRIGREWLGCTLRAGHGGMHADRGVKWG